MDEVKHITVWVMLLVDFIEFTFYIVKLSSGMLNIKKVVLINNITFFVLLSRWNKKFGLIGTQSHVSRWSINQQLCKLNITCCIKSSDITLACCDKHIFFRVSNSMNSLRFCIIVFFQFLLLLEPSGKSLDLQLWLFEIFSEELPLFLIKVKVESIIYTRSKFALEFKSVKAELRIFAQVILSFFLILAARDIEEPCILINLCTWKTLVLWVFNCIMMGRGYLAIIDCSEI